MTKITKKVLIVNQSAELYGSDRSLLDLLTILPTSGYQPVVVLPEQGPLLEKIRALGIEVYVFEIFKLSRSIFKLSTLVKMPFTLYRVFKDLSRLNRLHQFDLSYTNTLAVLGLPLWARMHRIPHIWHVREIIETPRFVSSVYKKIVPLLSDHIVCNSKNTLEWLEPPDHVSSHVIWNGIEATRRIFRNPYQTLSAPLPVVLLAGRINHWKGQDLLLAASVQNFKSGNLYNLVFLGSAAEGQEALVSALRESIKQSGFEKYIQHVDFVSDATPYYQHADLVVVPSTKPEPFGRVAIEAMACAKPVLAASHGGLIEIVQHQRTGLLFTPNSITELANCLKVLVSDAQMRLAFGEAGQIRQAAYFSLQAYQSKLLAVFAAIKH
ncbi:glycosyltransferase family 4 protein [Methylophilus aquaticus]|uniref:Glycosyltransferase family 4 protein n=1 Tax=Methylophilus aquaticus TaxID=1971610 RepID=A0ABT9JT75_9PROT|nr:glycosyltransferase family 4 protein [Methylophilus aquaticus]MDP8567781.1 glycosyltransferase family 4 protein [Methylophilus aquaticus]